MAFHKERKRKSVSQTSKKKLLEFTFTRKSFTQTVLTTGVDCKEKLFLQRRRENLFVAFVFHRRFCCYLINATNNINRYAMYRNCLLYTSRCV